MKPNPTLALAEFADGRDHPARLALPAVDLAIWPPDSLIGLYRLAKGLELVLIDGAAVQPMRASAR